VLTKLAAALLPAVLLAACSETNSASGWGHAEGYAPPVRAFSCGQEEPGSPPRPGSLRAFYPTKMTHTVSGDQDIEFTTETLIDVCEILGDDFPSGTHFLTVSAGKFDVTMPDGTLLLWSADLVPGLYEGPGTYTIDDEASPDIAAQSSIRSAAYLRFTGPLAGKVGLLEYRQLLEPCTLEIEALAVRGSVTCPKLGLSTDPDRFIEWTWAWERLPATEASRFPAEPTASSS
jgi:hypothetical protein